MALTRSLPTQHPSGLPITDTRRVLAGLVARNSDGTPRAGVLPAHANPLVAGRASMGYDVAPFIAATSRINTGVELIANDAVTTVATTAAPAANSRIDVIWVRSQFVQHADANNDVVFGVTQGTAAAVPTKPVIPTGALELATATILSTTTTTATVVVTQTHQYTAAAGGTVRFRTDTDALAWDAIDGSRAYSAASGSTFARVGGAWSVADTGFLIPSASQISAEGGGTITVASDGTISFSGATAINLDGIFDGRGMDAYEIIFDVGRVGSTGTGDWRVQYRAGGVTSTASNYVTDRVSYQNQGASGSAAATGYSDIQGFGIIMRGNSASARDSGTMRVHSPKLPRSTALIADALHLAAGAASTIMHTSVEFAGSNLFDGIRLLTAGAGSSNGTLRIRKVA
ncbi:hypothetical protein [Microbacterium sp. Leaf320]|uniref:hypothetical protein n=1 Tax=Microbacterium sp. Leaf320 TaxID=1736334 RepID=UPI000701C429|nr:hypothetical protein [Microbacterium sp. Leaf320]KQQ65695.1 hypothetical protein ASF63_10055 [Microbacterium sp. Leaf320]